ncbi:hypothetical protein BOTBODRAFT_154299 [Botryobasidium botryosum FD-172 SS1]|uniref:CAF1B/HIR1 beta-propeller domain-containing protein n=1 Tax=Botryobasidium botryosum (strain FD-172 SS1) TaxID=930990 RepID=A0A067MS16_BOTB1|nr:hypothetical protein BOTBODRAFT_154299 [Botryobasidium botryosum FD-172 SS1]
MRVRTLEIRWHNSLPIYACDFQPLTTTHLKRVLAPRIVTHSSSTPTAVPSPAESSQSYRFATAGSDNNVRVWMVHPNVLPPSVRASSSGAPPVPHPPRVEFLSTLSKHTAVVNVVRFSPNGELIASAGDDGMIAIWAPSDRPNHSYGSEASTDDAQYEKEHWRVRIIVRCTSREVYDLAWSPNGDYIIAGSTDNTARIFSAVDGTCVREITEHSHYVQGVAWDPMNEFVATQSSDRSVHVYGISTKRGSFEVHPVGKNARMHVRQSRTPSRTPSSTPRQSMRPQLVRRLSNASDTESAVTSASELRDDHAASFSIAAPVFNGPPTPSASIASTPSTMFPPKEHQHPRSRRSSFSGSNAPGSPAHSIRMARSPSPMPPLPAIRAAPTAAAATAAWASVKLYGDEGFTNFFRRLTFSPDGALLLTPAGQFEDPTVITGSSRASSSKPSGQDDPPIRPKKSHGSDASSSSVYIYSRANFSRPPVAFLPGHKTASVAVKFSPVLYELRQGVYDSAAAQAQGQGEVKRIVVERGKDQTIELNLGGSVGSSQTQTPTSSTPASSQTPVGAAAAANAMPSPAMSTLGLSTERPSTPSSHSHSQAQAQSSTTPVGSVFALPYRMLFAVATQDTVLIYDTQQAGPICLFTNLHYTSFTDVSWAPDGQSLMLASSDGYCSIVVFDEFLPLHHTQQHNLQLQSIAQSHQPHTTHAPSSLLSHSAVQSPSTALGTLPPIATGSVPSASAPVSGTASGSGSGSGYGRGDANVTPSRSSGAGQKRTEPAPPTPSASVDDNVPSSSTSGLGLAPGGAVEEERGRERSRDEGEQPKKKRRRIQLTHHGEGA